MKVVTMCDIGNQRTVNQDYVSYYQKENEAIVVLCDGMGGHKAGEVASLLTGEYIIKQYKEAKPFTQKEYVQEWLHQVILDVNRLLNKKSQEDFDLHGMGTTLVVALLVGDVLFVSHVGDSRAYLVSQRQLNQLTRDDTLVNALVDAGSITAEEAIHHPKKNMLVQAVGVSDLVNESYIEIEMHDEDILICSDGLYNSLTNQQIIDILGEDIELKDKGNRLVKEAKIYGGRDNIGLALISRKGAGE